VFTIEPMINEGGSGDIMWPDEWTVTTRDGKRSAQFEHMLLVTETGVEVLSARVGAPTNAMPPWDEAAFTRPLPPAAAAAAATAAVAAVTPAAGGVGGDGAGAGGAGVAATAAAGGAGSS
jgi:hypothetical protein